MARRHRHFPRSTVLFSETVEAWVFIASIALAVWLIKSDALSMLLVVSASNFGIIGSFIEGLLFTSILTTAPAIVAIIESASYVPAWELAIVGGIGAVCGDLLVFRFIQSRLIERFLRLMFSPRMLRMGTRIAKGPFWWLAPLCGAIIIASPFPDEIGLMMMGLSHIRLIQFIPLSFAANAAGIYIMASLAQNFG